jgi:CrcB protein
VRSLVPRPFPLGTLLVNVLGCFLLGIVAAGVASHGWPANLQLLLGTGFCGGLTTFSTFSVEAIELLQRRLTLAGIGYLAGSLLLGIGAAASGYALVT